MGLHCTGVHASVLYCTTDSRAHDSIMVTYAEISKLTKDHAVNTSFSLCKRRTQFPHIPSWLQELTTCSEWHKQELPWLRERDGKKRRTSRRLVDESTLRRLWRPKRHPWHMTRCCLSAVLESDGIPKLCCSCNGDARAGKPVSERMTYWRDATIQKRGRKSYSE